MKKVGAIAMMGVGALLGLSAVFGMLGSLMAPGNALLMILTTVQLGIAVLFFVAGRKLLGGDMAAPGESPDSPAVSRLLGGILLAVGVLMAGTGGLCVALIGVEWLSNPSSDAALMAMLSGVSVLTLCAGIGAILFGVRLVRQ